MKKFNIMLISFLAVPLIASETNSTVDGSFFKRKNPMDIENLLNPLTEEAKISKAFLHKYGLLLKRLNTFC